MSLARLSVGHSIVDGLGIRCAVARAGHQCRQGAGRTRPAQRARRLKRQQGLGLLVIDYLQLMTGTSNKGDNRVQEVSEITNGLKALAKELHIPIIALSQLSRAVESTATTSGRSSRICVNRAPSSRTPTLSCSCSGRSIIWSG